MYTHGWYSCYNPNMHEDNLQVGKMRYAHYTIAYHLIWLVSKIPPSLHWRGIKGDEEVDCRVL